MTLERFLFEKGFKPDTHRTRVIATFVHLILNPTFNTKLTLPQEVALTLNLTPNAVAQHLFWSKDRFNKKNNNAAADKTPLEVMYTLAYEFKDLSGN